MKRSDDRILTTHCGSLVRTRPIIEGMKARTLGQPYDAAQLVDDICVGIHSVVQRQVAAGIDVPNDGEYNRRGFTSYIHERLGGLERIDSPTNDLDQTGHARERDDFPDFYAQYDRMYRTMWMLPGVNMDGMLEVRSKSDIFRLTGAIEYRGGTAVKHDIEVLLKAVDGQPIADAFMTAITPAITRKDRGVLDVYPSQRAYLYALADALHEEYCLITESGLILQLDIPQLEHSITASEDGQTDLDLAIEVINHALLGIPESAVRLHYCGGSGNRPHTQDVPIASVIRQLLGIHAQAYGFEAATPRHEHEWQLWADVKLPDGKIIIPGLISQSTNVVEHPELVAWRIKNFAGLVGKENVIAGVDCGFSQDWDVIRVHPSIQWAKLKALADGAALASRDLWR